MRIVVPSVEMLHSGLETGTDILRPEQFIEKVGRTCYKSEDKITEDSAAKFVSALIKRGHEAVLEHWSYIFKTTGTWYEQILEDWDLLLHNGNLPLNDNLRSFLRFSDQVANDGEERYIVSGNIRAWRDYTKACREGFGFVPGYLHGMIKCNPLFFPEFIDWVPVNVVNNILHPITPNELVGMKEHYVHHDVTIKFVCDRGVSHEIVRHRTASYAQESTRYCNYGLDKFGNEITVVRPSWCDEGSDVYDIWRNGCLQSESAYFTLLSENASPQEARSVLPSSLKTELVKTATLGNWDHFFFLRSARDAHPDIREVSQMSEKLINAEVYDKLNG